MNAAVKTKLRNDVRKSVGAGTRDGAERTRGTGPKTPRAGSGHDGASAYLTTYFRDLSALRMLSAEEELANAKHIEELELAFWRTALALPAAYPVVSSALAQHSTALGESTVLARAGSVDIPAKTLSKMAVSLRNLDCDRLLVEDVMTAAELAARGAALRAVPKVIPVQSRRFSGWLTQLRSAHRDAASARADFVRANLRLVVSIARRFNHGRMSLADLIQEGNLGLIKAVERYDYRRGFRFSTYASWWIRHGISRGLADKGREVRLPVHMIDSQHRLNRARRELTASLGRAPDSQELATATGTDLDKVEKMRGWLLEHSISLDRPIGGADGQSRPFADFLVDPDGATGPADALLESASSREIRLVLAELRPIEADILRHRFGLDTQREMTLKEIGDKYQLSRERIRQLQEQALLNMRRALDKRAG
jgi:RNA polymerase primary sigma factor